MPRPRDRTSDPVSVFGTRPTLQPLPDLGLDLSLACQRMLPPELLPEHRFPELEKLKRSPEPLSDQLSFGRGHRSRARPTAA